jgi:ubiquinone/menaquinone biosynthesis C-methylase UbiE
MKGYKKYDFSVFDVSKVYAGPGGQLWELLMGEQIHVGGANQTDFLAKKIGLDKKKGNIKLLDICSALGGPARHLAEKYDVAVLGLDITPEMIEEAEKRTKGKTYSNKIEYRIGSGLDIPEKSNVFDIVWGQDAWVYIRDKDRLINETYRVCKPGGILAFTDWIWGPVEVTEEESDVLMEFMVFPSMQTLDGYVKLIEETGYSLREKKSFQEDFAEHLDEYFAKLKKNRSVIIKSFGKELYQEAENGILAWRKAAHERKVSRGMWIADKPKS